MKKPARVRFLFANEFLNMLILYRALWIKGRYGGGKTLLAVLLAAWLKVNEKIDKVHSNFPTVISEPVTWDKRKDDAAFILDEAHAFVEGRKDVDTYGKYLRKTNYYLLMPSVMPPHNRLTFFSVQRIFNGYGVGIPVWFFRWDIRSMRDKVDGWFMVLNPHLGFGSYPTKYIPFDDGDIGDHIQFNVWRSAQDEADRQGRKNKVKPPERMQDNDGRDEDNTEGETDKKMGEEYLRIIAESLTNDLDDVSYRIDESGAEIEDAVRQFKKAKLRR